MKRIDIIWLAAAAAFCAELVLGGEVETPSSVLLPAGRPSVFKTHELCGASKQECATCHRSAAKSRWASERLIPNMEVCGPCHESAREVTIAAPATKDCRSCHGDLKDGGRPIRGDYPRPNIRFSHAAHNPHMKCGKCHPRAAARSPSGSRPDIPSMRECYDCHKKRGGGADCRTCHIANKDGRMVTEFKGRILLPPTWLKGPTHGTEWIGRHAQTAGADSDFCGSCHRESFCRDCHTGRLRPRNVHPGDWLTAHGVSTRLDNPRCRGCHRKQSFCLTCHRRSGVAPDSPAEAGAEGGSGRYHRDMENSELMRRAKHDITSCVSCHSESSCITCHATVKPHPANFDRKCKALAARNRRACAKCHSDEAWKRCK
jgi:hypothetical protein